MHGRARACPGVPGRARRMLGACSAHTRRMHGACPAHARRMHGACSAHARRMHGACSAHARRMLGACPDTKATNVTQILSSGRVRPAATVSGLRRRVLGGAPPTPPLLSPEGGIYRNSGINRMA